MPYVTGRQTTAGTMLSFMGPSEYQEKMVEMSLAAEKLETDNEALVDLQAMGVDYVFIGCNGNFSEPGLSAKRLSHAINVQVPYRNAGAAVLRISSD